MDGFFTADFTADPGGAIIEVNDAYCRLVGYSREELLQMRIADLEADESPEEVARHKAQNHGRRGRPIRDPSSPQGRTGDSG